MKKSGKKLMSVVLSAAMVMSLAACSSQSTDATTATEATTTAETTQETTTQATTAAETTVEETAAEAEPKTEGNQQADIVVIGGGGAGMTAAIEAVLKGATDVVILEKMPITGGNTTRSTGGLNAADRKSVV